MDAAGARKHRLVSRALPLAASLPAGPGDEQVFAIPLYERLALTNPRGDPVATLLTREQLGEIRAALPTLTAKERIALAGVLNDRSHRQLAAEHDTTHKAIASAVQRARTKLAAGDALAA